MCQEAQTDDAEYCTVGELKALLGELVMIAAHDPSWTTSDRDCLCWVDIEASAKKAGWSAEWDGWKWKLSQPPETARPDKTGV